MVNLRADPFERAMHAMHESIGWADWTTRRVYALSGAAVIATNFLKTFLNFPPDGFSARYTSMDCRFQHL
jgi:hypothetical protein